MCHEPVNCEDDLRLCSNELKYKYVKELNQTLELLRQHLSFLTPGLHLSEIETLRLATNYIKMLTYMLVAKEEHESGLQLASVLTSGLADQTISCIAENLNVNPQNLLKMKPINHSEDQPHEI